MADTSNATTKRERRRLKAERLRAEQRRREQRRTIAYTVGAVAVLGIAVAIMTGLGGGSGEGAIQPSASSEVSIAGAPRTSPLAAGDAVPSFSAPGFHMASSGGGRYAIVRERVDWSSYEGAPTVLSIWAPWCPHCQKELPVLSDAVASHPGVELVTVVTSIGAHPGPTANGYLAENALTFPAAIDDEGGTLAQGLGVQGFPTLYFVGSDGTVSYAQEGEVPADALERELSKLG